ncbi:MAG: hypothetical protein WBJ34_03245 [Syntrophomonadaceae bacterium]
MINRLNLPALNEKVTMGLRKTIILGVRFIKLYPVYLNLDEEQWTIRCWAEG